tara:strand:- start:2601 stop:4427 length:1827 start_codon:yes stop_codon:yes gene_type:complete
MSGMAALISLSPMPVNAQDFSDVANTAQKITVRIEGATQGSGVIVRKEGNIYTVLTAWHVIKDVNPNEELAIITSDGKEHQRISGSAQQLGTIDLAKLTFKSSENYKFVTPKSGVNTNSGKKIFVGGFPLATSAVPYRLFRFLEGNVVARADIPISGGYQLLYSNQTLPGMSGGAVLDKDANLIAIHGRGEISINETGVSNVSVKTGTNQGIPIKFFFDQSIAETKRTKNYGDYLALAKSQITEYQQKSDDFYSDKSNRKREKSIQFVRQNIYLIDSAVENAKKAVELEAGFESHLTLGTAYWYKDITLSFTYGEMPKYGSPEEKEWRSAQKNISDNVIKNLNIALEYKPENVDALIYRGSVLEDIETGGGIGDFTRALSVDRDNKKAREKRANAYHGLALAEGGESVTRKQSYLRLSLEDSDVLFREPNNIEPNDYLNRGLVRLELSKTLTRRERGEKIRLLNGACKDATIASKAGVGSFKFIWDSFEKECAKLDDLVNDDTPENTIKIPNSLDPSYEYMTKASSCPKELDTHQCNFLRQINDVKMFTAYTRCEWLKGNISYGKAITLFEDFRLRPGLSEEAYAVIYNEGGIDAKSVNRQAKAWCNL